MRIKPVISVEPLSSDDRSATLVKCVPYSEDYDDLSQETRCVPVDFPYSDQSYVNLFPYNSSSGIITNTTPIILPVSAAAPDQTTGAGAMDVNAYKVDFDIPEGTPTGDYQIEVYNGHGGVYGLSVASNASGSGSVIHIAAAPTAPSTGYFTLEQALDNYNAANSSSVALDTPGGTINPAAVNDAMIWAARTAGNYYGTGYYYNYFGIQLPPGEIDITDSTDIIQMEPYVHLVGAGDTGDPLTGTVINAATDPGTTIEGLIELPDMVTGSHTPANMAISDMSLNARGDLEPPAGGHSNYYGAIYDEGWVIGLTLQRLTIDATTDNPAAPNVSGENDPDIWINNNAQNFQLLDSTLIGSGFDGYGIHSTFDNDHFIGCGAISVVIGSQGGTDQNFTRCTDTGLVNNILCPGGDVEYDSDKGLLEATLTGAGLYVGDNIVSDAYNVDPSGDGEEISVEAQSYGDVGNGYTQIYNQDVVVYQNTLSGDGAESLSSEQGGRDTIGVSVDPGYNIVVADNDISNVSSGIHTYNDNGDQDKGVPPPRYLATYMPFAMFVDNSIHNTVIGINLEIGVVPSEQNQPWFIGCSFNGNIISGGRPGSSGIAITTYSNQSNNPPQILMNVFNGEIVTGVGTAIKFVTPTDVPPDQVENTVFSNGLLSADGDSDSVMEFYDPTNPPNPAIFLNESWEDFWNVPDF